MKHLYPFRKKGSILNNSEESKRIIDAARKAARAAVRGKKQTLKAKETAATSPTTVANGIGE